MSDEKLEPLDFNELTLVEEIIPINGKRYTLREASGEAACKYRNAMLAATQLGPDGKPSSVRGMASVEPLLVSLCLFTSDNRLVQLDVIQSWPQRVSKALYERVKKISELDADDTIESLTKEREAIDKKIANLSKTEEASKNELSVTPDGSA